MASETAFRQQQAQKEHRRKEAWCDSFVLASFFAVFVFLLTCYSTYGCVIVFTSTKMMDSRLHLISRRQELSKLRTNVPVRGNSNYVKSVQLLRQAFLTADDNTFSQFTTTSPRELARHTLSFLLDCHHEDCPRNPLHRYP
jgi:hypothetical protein